MIIILYILFASRYALNDVILTITITDHLNLMIETAALRLSNSNLHLSFYWKYLQYEWKYGQYEWKVLLFVR